MAEDSASSEQPRALTSRRLAGNYSRGSVGQVSGSRVDAYACLTIIVGIRMTGISRPSATQMVKYGKERGGEREREREKERERERGRGAGRLSSRICVLPRGYRATHTYRRAVRTLLWHVCNKARTHFTPGRTLRSPAREAFSERSSRRATGRSFQLFNG